MNYHSINFKNSMNLFSRNNVKIKLFLEIKSNELQ